MSSEPAKRITARYRVPLAIGIVVLSIVLPMALACWSALSEMRDKGIAGAPTKRLRLHYGSVKNGELWHAEMRLSNINAPPTESRILRLDLKTGVERDTGLVFPGEFGWPFRMGEELYVRSQTAIFRRSENELVKLASLPRSAATFHASVFLWEGRLTTIQQIAEGGCRLVHLSDGTWIGGAAWLTHDVAQPEFEFGNQRVSPAPLWRRAIATGVDAALLATVILGLGRLLFAGLGNDAGGFDETTLAHGLFDVEQGLYGAITGTPTFVRGPDFRPAFASLLEAINTFPALAVLSMAVLLVICGAKVFVEGRCGVPPGKYLLGLRTMRTTLRPCGFARALVRNLVYCVDFPLVLTPLPAAISLMFSDHRQRLGDRAADTLVIRADSMRG